MLKTSLEPGKGFQGLKKDWKCTSRSLFSALTSIVFVLSGAIPMLSSAASSAGLSSKQAASFVMCGIAIGALISIAASLYYRMPFFFASSLTGIAVLTPMFDKFSIAEMTGGFIIAGIAVAVIGISGITGWIAKYLPLPVVLGMVAGVFMSYGLNIISSITSDPLSGFIIIGAFVLFSLLTKKIPPTVVSLIAGVLCAVFIYHTDFTYSTEAGFSLPVFILPDFSGHIVLSVSLPLVIMALADIFKGYGVLKSGGYDIPLNAVTTLSGIGSIFAAFGLSHTITLAGPVMAILSGKDAGEKRLRFISAVIFCCALIAVCAFLWLLLPIITQLPSSILSLICGLAMTNLLVSSLQGAFGAGKFQMGALAAFLTGVSNVTICGISAPVWAIVFGLIVTISMEREHWQ